jgi:hypothetical protein
MDILEHIVAAIVAVTAAAAFALMAWAGQHSH